MKAFTFRLALCTGIGLMSAVLLRGQPTGQWDFDAGNLNATVGSPMQYADGTTAGVTLFGTTTSFGIPAINGTNAAVMKFPALTQPRGYLMPTPGVSGGGSLVNDYTLIMDVFYPASSSGVIRPIIQTDDGVITPDADIIINAGGALGPAEGPLYGNVTADAWHRIAIVLQGSAQQLRFYIDGIEVGSRSIPEPFDSRFALSPDATSQILNNNTTNAAPGYVNSIQMRNVALASDQVAALGGPSAAGIPQQIPVIPSFLVQFTPRGPVADRNTAFGAVINTGDAVILDSSISLTLDGAVLASPQITRNGKLIDVLKASAGPISAGVNHTLVLTYTDDQVGQKSFTNRFKAALLFEDFEGLALGQSPEEQPARTNVWTDVGPAGWVVDRSGVPGYTNAPDNNGVKDWAGWTFANKDWWVVVAGNQERVTFNHGQGTVAIADPDEWDDAAHPQFDGSGNALYFNSFMTTKSVSLAGVAPNSVFVRFDSSWRPEGFDDWGGTNNQTGIVTVRYNNGTPIEILHWDSQDGGPFFHPDSTDEPVSISLNNPAGATSMTLAFSLTRGANDWWWAFDNLEVNTGPIAPGIISQPQSQYVYVGANVSFSVQSAGSDPLRYQWYFNGTTPVGTNGPVLSLLNVQSNNAGNYFVVVTNDGGSVTSAVANLTVFSGMITQDLVLHLPFNGDYTDATGRGNNGAPVNSPTFTNGFLGEAVHVISSRTNVPNDYVTLGYPNDLKFGASDFSFSFWTKVFSQSDDKPFISNKDWDSGSNPGWVLAPLGSGMKWNIRDDQSSRKDSPGVGPQFVNTSWHHVVVTFHRTTVGRIYVDGVLVNTTVIAPDAGKVVGSADTALSVNIGQDGAGDYTDGNAASVDMLMDDLAIWRRVVTPQEVAAIYNAGLLSNDVASVSVNGPVPRPVITGQPQSQTVSVGGTVNFSATTGGGVPQSYQWYFNNSPLGGATGTTLVITNAQAGNGGSYVIVASNTGGSATSAPAVLTVVSSPVISVQPTNRTVNQNLDTSLSVTATGGGLTYQWQHAGTNLPNATNAALAFPSIQPSQGGTYRVTVSNAGGSATSDPAVITVLPVGPITVTGQWDFNNGDLSATVGNPLQYFNATVQADTSFGTTTSFGVPAIGGQVGNIMRFSPSAPSWGGYITRHGASPNGGGVYVNQYTLIYDMYYPPTSDRTWRSLWQTSTGNANDGDFFVNPANGVGISGNYQGVVNSNDWHRIVLAIDLNGAAVAKFIDGVKVGYQTLGAGTDGRWALDPTALLFGDEDGDNSLAFVNSVQFRNGKMSDADIAALGGPTANGIPGGAAAFRVSFARQGNDLVLSWTGGQEPFTVQKKATLGDSNWTDVVTTSNRTATVPIGTGSEFFRVVSRATFTATLNGANERPDPVTPSGTGTGTFFLDGNQLTVNITYTGLTSPVNAAHLHGPATSDQFAGVLVGFIPALGPSGNTAGTFSGVVNLSTLNAQLVRDGLTYANIHTSNNGGGEIRGQLLPNP